LHKKAWTQLPWCSQHQLISSASIVSLNCCFYYAYIYCCYIVTSISNFAFYILYYYSITW
jgi:hypothetical protein